MRRPATPLVSLRSWHQPDFFLEGSDPDEIISGGANEWPQLHELLKKRWRDKVEKKSSGGALGYFSYEGDFWFAFFSDLKRRAELEKVSDFLPSPILFSEKEEKIHRTQWRSNFTQAEFEEIVRRAQEYIRAGDIYQVNLAQKFQTLFSGDGFALFESLKARTPAAGAAYLNTGAKEILSSSPELFLKITGNKIVTRPIKGTRPRSADPERDRQLAEELKSDPKELAELIMITDLERNDLGQVCEYGKVTVPELAKLEAHPQVYHLVSTVEGILKKEIDPFLALQGCFPGGSITGAPKKRACEIIAELEPMRRDVYTGAIGYFLFNGDAAFNIAIRTMALEGNELSFCVGSGITAGSDPAREYEETLHKGLGMKLALADFLNNKLCAQVTQ